MNRALDAIAVGLSLYLISGAAAAAGDTEQRAQDCSSVAHFYALMLQGEKRIAEGNEDEGESFMIRAKRLSLNERQQRIQRRIRPSIAPPDESYLHIYRTCWNAYWNLTAGAARHDPLPPGNAPGPNGAPCRCAEVLCDSASPHFDS